MKLDYKNINQIKLAEWALRIGLILVLVYAGIDSLAHPLDWVGYLPNLITKHFSALVLLKIFAVYELMLAAWLLSGRLLKYCSLICTLTFVLIVTFNYSQLIITFRDIGLAFTSLALFFICSKDSIYED